MMRFHDAMRIAVCLFLLFAVTVPIAAQSSHPLDLQQSKILALENAWNQAEEHKDVRALDLVLDPNVLYIDAEGVRMNKAQFLASVKDPALHQVQIVNESMTVSVYGDVAVVTGVYRGKGERHGKPYLTRGRFTDIWLYRSGGWLCMTSQSTLISR